MKRLGGFCFAGAIAILATLLYAGPVKVGEAIFTHTIDTLTDTASVIGFTPSTAVNDMVYADTFGFGTDTNCYCTYTADGTATIAEITAGMAASINESCADYFVGADSTTYFAVHGIDAGLAWVIIGTDTTCEAAADTSLLTEFTAGSSTDSALIYMFSMQYPEEYSALYGNVTLQPATSLDDGYGKSLIATVVLNKFFQGTATMIDSAYGTSLPLTLTTQWGKDTTGGGVDYDTMWGEFLQVRVTVADSMTESTTASFDHDVDWYLIPRK